MKPAPASALINAFEFEEAAKAKLPPALFSEIADGPRGPFDRITLRPRLMVNTRKLDLSQELFGVRHFAPIIAAASPSMKLLHPGGETEFRKGAAGARTEVLHGLGVFDQLALSARAARPVVPGDAKFLVFQGDGADWRAFDRLRATVNVPIAVSGTSLAAARVAANHGASGFLITQHWRAGDIARYPMDVLVPIVDEVGARIPVLIGGGFRRGTDILMALAMGAKAVVVTRPVAWALAAYGAEGVETLLALLQTELARSMAMCGRVTLAELDRTLVKVHRA